MACGKVYLIGAGPGDEGLLTLKALHKLKECTVIMYDRLAGTEILNYANENCKFYYCGKGPGSHYRTQEEINRMIVKFAKQGHVVGRIKGGDPYIFGRGGEEILALRAENIEFEVIPGITSFIAVLNYAGIPVTHRNMARSFHVFTGRTSKDLNINWDAAAHIGGTLIFMMGFSSLNTICTKLIENGMDETTPCAVIMSGTTANQKKSVSNLKNIYAETGKDGLHSPCIFVIGEVVEFNDKFNWYEKKPLFGRNICITRSKKQSSSMRKKLMDLGAQVTEIHSIKIKYTEDNMKDYINKLRYYDYIVFTSSNGVASFFHLLQKQNYDIRSIKGVFAAIGPATESEIKKRGIIPRIIAKKFVAESLYEEMKKHLKPGDKIFVPRSKNSRNYLVEVLRNEGCQVDECYIYETEKGDLVDGECFNAVDTVIFTSPTTVRNMIELVGEDSIRRKKIISIGPITGNELEKHNMAYEMSDSYTADGIIQKLVNENKN